MDAAFATNGTKTHSNATVSATFGTFLKKDFMHGFISIDET